MVNYAEAYQELWIMEKNLRYHGYTNVTDTKIQIDMTPRDEFEQQGTEAPVKKDQHESDTEMQDEVKKEDEDMI